jgi:hypothetical protein
MVFMVRDLYPVTMPEHACSLKDIVKGYEAALASFLPLPEGTWALRSQALVLRAALGGTSQEPVKGEVADLALDVSDTCDKLYRFENNLIRWFTAKGYTRLATLFDITTIGSLALHDLRDGKWKKPMDLLGAVISEGSMIIASLQYTKAQEENMKAMTEDHISELYGLMWEVVPLLRGSLDPAEILEAQKGLDGFFMALRSGTTTLETRIAVIVLLYVVVIKVKSDKMLDKARGKGKKKKADEEDVCLI